MKDALEKLKHIPMPIWIGLGLVLIFILLMNRSSSTSATTTGPVSTATMGTQGSQAGAGTDQQLGNLSQITQSGFDQIAKQENANSALLGTLANGMTGVGTPMQQFGGTIQASQNASALSNAVSGTPGQNAGTQPSSGVASNHILVGQYKVALPGGGDVTVNANSAEAARENAKQETGMDVSKSSIATVNAPRSDLAA